MNNFKLPEHKQEYISNFISDKAYVPSGKRNVDFSVNLLNLNYENGATYIFSIYIYEAENYKELISGKLNDNEATHGGLAQEVSLVALLSDSEHYSNPSYIDLPIKMTVKNLIYETDKIYAAVFILGAKAGREISRSVTYIKGVENE